MRELTIDGRLINDDSDPYVIAEIGNTHCGSVETCKELILVAKACGADAVKLQKKNLKTLYTKAFYNKPYDNPNSYGPTYGAHKEALEFNREQWQEIVAYAKDIDITLFATPFDEVSADFLADLDLPAYKIASADLTNIPLINRIRTFKRPILVSTGGASWQDIDRAYEALKGSDIVLFHCVASYPNKASEMNLAVIEKMRYRYPNTTIGFSNHFNGIVMCEAAYMLGARVIEVHFTLNHTWKGTDHALSLEPQGLESLVHNLKRLRVAIGTGEKMVLDSEAAPIKKMGKSLWPTRAIKAGEVIKPEDVAIKSPGGGLPPYEIDRTIGTIAICDLSTEKPIEELQDENCNR